METDEYQNGNTLKIEVDYLLNADYLANEKERKLTSDSGFGDEVIGRNNYIASCNKDQMEIDIQSNSKRRSTTELEYPFDDNFQGLIARDYHGLPIMEIKKKRQRRVTPVPKSTPLFRTSEGKMKYSKNKFISLEEEDAADVEEFSAEEDFVFPSVKSLKSHHLSKRNSWHGITEEEASAYSSYDVALLAKSKSKSLEYFKTKREEKMASSYPFDYSISDAYEKQSQDTNKDKIDDRCLAKTESNTQSCFDNNSTFLLHEADNSEVRDSCEADNLPLWMRQAEAGMSSSEAGSGLSSNDEAVSKKLDIPSSDWKKMNEANNKTNRLWSNQRKQITKEKNSQKTRQRKITPSEAPSKSSLEQLSSLKQKTATPEWSLAEEEEEMEEGE